MGRGGRSDDPEVELASSPVDAVADRTPPPLLSWPDGLPGSAIGRPIRFALGGMPQLVRVMTDFAAHYLIDPDPRRRSALHLRDLAEDGSECPRCSGPCFHPELARTILERAPSFLFSGRPTMTTAFAVRRVLESRMFSYAARLSQDGPVRVILRTPSAAERLDADVDVPSGRCSLCHSFGDTAIGCYHSAAAAYLGPQGVGLWDSVERDLAHGVDLWSRQPDLSGGLLTPGGGFGVRVWRAATGLVLEAAFSGPREVSSSFGARTIEERAVFERVTIRGDACSCRGGRCVHRRIAELAKLP